MATFLLFLLGVVVVILGTWLWGALTGLAGASPVHQIEEIQALEESERMVPKLWDH